MAATQRGGLLPYRAAVRYGDGVHLFAEVAEVGHALVDVGGGPDLPGRRLVPSGIAAAFDERVGFEHVQTALVCVFRCRNDESAAFRHDCPGDAFREVIALDLEGAGIA